ncbi:methyl-accepting chemotaxis sensory transducer with Cache sensor [Novosphingobium sp. PhB57]|uniref:methyl-accepting chemotaxis protein n=3 Tax=unclassified Novosphingobium TaxID=2644732 RepID=UPI00104F9E38|nr:methyl-accepting chemotaxis protein [Novosphingobium sp. PhB57]TCU54449.1 methyl-accepting chemotaxis sensory transducer with Cache sensor [Novosphingobium sp. PhB57]
MRDVFNRMHIAGKLMTVAGLAIAVLLLLGFTAVVVETGSAVGALSDQSAVAQADAEGNRVETEVATFAGTARALASTLGDMHARGTRDRGLAVSVLKTDLLKSKVAQGSWAMIAPDQWDGGDAGKGGQPGSGSNGSFSPYWVKAAGVLTMSPNNEADAYEKPYFRKSFESGAGAIVDPYSYDVNGTTMLMTSITYPVRSGERVIGVVGVDMDLGGVSERLSKLKPFGTGRVMLLSASATWVANPDSSKLSKPYEGAGLDEVKAALTSGQVQVVSDIDVDGVATRRVIQPVVLEGLGTTWALVLDVPEATIAAPARSMAWQLVIGGLVIVAAVLATLFYAAGGIIGRPMAKLSGAVDRLAKGEHCAIPELGREDEIGTMARAADVFRQAAADRAEADRRSAEEQKIVTSAVGDGLDALRQGDLTRDITEAFPAGYAALKDNFNAALAELRRMIGAVAGSASGIQTGSAEIAQASEDLARRTEANAASLEETSAALVQIDQRLKASASASTRTVRRADEALSTVSGGRAVAGEAVAAMDRVSQSAKGIDSVIEGVDKIAFQTRVLAMNAAVEAGRAGDAGRGFAVVADLVSALAMRSEEEAKRAREQLTATQTDIGTAVDAVQRVDGAFETISEGVGEVHALLGQMAQDNQAQSTAITQISVAVSTMDHSTQQNAAMVEETSAAARNLTTEAGSLNDQAARFDTGARRQEFRLSSVA